MKIYLIRHGQTTGDLEDRYGGDYDDHLTQKGVDQAQELGQELSFMGIEKLIVSPKIRAQETAQILNNTFKTKMETNTNFREQNRYGVLTGLTKKEARDLFPNDVNKIVDIFTTVTDAEPYINFKKRISNELDKVLHSKIPVVGIVTHGGPIRLIVREVLKRGELIKIDDCAYLILNYENKQLNLEKIKGAVLDSSL